MPVTNDEVRPHGAPLGEGAARAAPASAWVNVVNLLVGAWLVTSPASLGYTSTEMTRSDVTAGLVLMLLALAGLLYAGARYTPAFVGLWLVLAPLLFWSPDPAAYANDTLAGALVLTLTLLAPSGLASGGRERPAGWSYNPSSFAQRAPVLVLGVIGFLTARYLAAYQLGYVAGVWDPLFGAGSEEVLRSGVARAWPVSDAGLGALACLAAVGVAFLGDDRRWRSMPWLVVLFGLLIAPLGIFGVALVVLQPLAAGAWCTWCLVTSAAMLLMIPFTIDEVVATLQFLRQSRREGRSGWWTFWLGGPDTVSPLEVAEEQVGEPVRDRFEPRSAWRGVGAPASLLASVLVGGWLVASPWVLGTASGLDHLLGAVVIAVGVVSLAEVARPLRYLTLIVAVVLVLAPSADPNSVAAWSDRIAGLLLIVLALPVGRLREHYGRLDLALSWPLRSAVR